MRGYFLLSALLMFAAGRASTTAFWMGGDRDYTVTGSLHIASDGDEKQVCELRIGNATDAKKKLLLVGKPDMALAQFCRDYAGARVRLTITPAHDSTKDAE